RKSSSSTWRAGARAACASPPTEKHGLVAEAISVTIQPARTMSAESWTPPPRFDDYRIVRRVGAGAMGEVYLGEDTVLERAVAITFIATTHAPSEMARQR